MVLLQAKYVQAGCRWLLRRVGFPAHADSEARARAWDYSGAAVSGGGGEDGTDDAAPLDRSHVEVSRFTFEHVGARMRLVEYHCNPAHVRMTGFAVWVLAAWALESRLARVQPPSTRAKLPKRLLVLAPAPPASPLQNRNPPNL